MKKMAVETQNVFVFNDRSTAVSLMKEELASY